MYDTYAAEKRVKREFIAVTAVIVVILAMNVFSAFTRPPGAMSIVYAIAIALMGVFWIRAHRAYKNVIAAILETREAQDERERERVRSGYYN